MTRRVVLGKYNDGVNYGLRCSLPGVDALTDDSNAGGFSFDSNWTDIVGVAQVGTVTGSPPTISFSSLGYIPYVEIRQISGSTIFDDGQYNANFQLGLGATITSTSATVWALNTGGSILYVVYKLAVGSG